ncbi:hypothetical protein [Nonomuraea rosea]
MEFQGWSGGLALTPRDYVEDGDSVADIVRAAGPIEGEALYLFALGSAATMARLHLAGIAGLRLNPRNVMIGARGQVSFAPGPRDSQFPSSDVLDWADVIVFAATGQWQGPEPGLDWLLPRLCTMIGDCHRRDPSTRPTAVDLVHTLLGYPGTPQRATLNDLLLEAENRTRPYEPEPEPARAQPPRSKRARAGAAARAEAAWEATARAEAAGEGTTRKGTAREGTPGGGDPARVWSARVDLGGYGPVQLGPGRTDSTRPEPPGSRSDRADQARVRSDRVDQAGVRPDWADQSRVRSDRVDQEHVRSDRVAPGRVEPDQLEAGHFASARRESRRGRSARRGAARARSEQVESAQLGLDRLKPAHVEPDWPESSDVDPDWLEPSPIEPNWMEGTRIEPDRLGPGPLGSDRLQAGRLRAAELNRRLFEPEVLETPSAPLWRRPPFLAGIVIGILIVAALAAAVTMIAGQARQGGAQNASLGEPLQIRIGSAG